MHNYDVENDLFLERPYAGSLLLAAPMLDDPNFHRSVIYLLEHSAAGSLGLVINRPTEQVVTDGLQPWRVLSSAPEVIFEGGPVEPNALIAMANVDPPNPVDLHAPGQGQLTSIDLSQPANALLSEVRQLRIFRGYSGWSSGQLDAELAQGSWLIARSDPFDVFSPHPQGLWRNVLRRSGGPKSLLADAPDDLAWN